MSVGEVTGDRSSAGIFIRLPKDLADQFPSLGEEDTSPSHTTFLYGGLVEASRQALWLEIVQGIVASELEGPVRASLGPLAYITHPGQGRRVPYCPVRFSHDMAALKWRLREGLLEAGFEVMDRFPLVYQPHVTLGYLEGLEATWQGPVPKGSWEFDTLEVWGLPVLKKIKIPPVRSGRYPDMARSLVAGQGGATLTRMAPMDWPEGRHYYKGNLRKDIFVHFTPEGRVPEILASGRLLMRPPYKKFGIDAVTAVSAQWGVYLPGVQTTHSKGPLQAIVFQTRTLPQYGVVEEVIWKEDVVFTRARAVSFRKGVEMLQHTPEQLMDGDEVLYGKIPPFARIAANPPIITAPYIKALLKALEKDTQGFGVHGVAGRYLTGLHKSLLNEFGIPPFPVADLWLNLEGRGADAGDIQLLRGIPVPRPQRARAAPTFYDAQKLLGEVTGKPVLFSAQDDKYAPRILNLIKGFKALKPAVRALWDAEVKQVALREKGRGSEGASWERGKMVLHLQDDNKPSTWAFILTHELGHAFEEKLGLRVTPWDETPYGQAPFVSAYAEANATEDFAETFRAYHVERGALKRLAPGKYRDMDMRHGGSRQVQARAIPLDKASLRALSKDIMRQIKAALLKFRSGDIERPLFDQQGFNPRTWVLRLGVMTLADVRGNPLSLPVQMVSRHEPGRVGSGKREWVLGGNVSTQYRGDGGGSGKKLGVELRFNSGQSVARAMANLTLVEADVYSVLLHEVTHVKDVLRFNPGNMQDPVVYHNDPQEVRAFLQQIVDEALDWAEGQAESFNSFTPNVDALQSALEHSYTYQRIQKDLTDKNRRTILKAVGQALVAAAPDLREKYKDPDWPAYQGRYQDWEDGQEGLFKRAILRAYQHGGRVR